MMVFQERGAEPPLRELIRFAETRAVTADIAKEYLVTALAEESNILSEVCERMPTIGREPTVGDSLRAAAMEDLTTLWAGLTDPLPGYVPSAGGARYFPEYQQSIQSLVSSAAPEELLERLVAHYTAFGGGAHARYLAFRWQDGLMGVENPDSVSLSSLFCLDDQKAALTKNTVSFLHGLPAENALLYGSRGSGKSSMVKALLNEYYRDGLRVAEISRERLTELPMLIDSVKNRRFRTIVFMDDLSFEEREYEYKNLKVILEGQLEKQPENVLFYATSNRRHVVHESWSERLGDEIHASETISEKLSLAERFGISLYFPATDQETYFAIIEGILSARGIPMTDRLRADAVEWELHHGGRSGRTAARFAKTIR